jgi:putative nucleotidyltransferase with HDIG domain
MKAPYLLTGIVAAAAIAALAGLLSYYPIPYLRLQDLLGVASFIVVGILGECMAIDFGKGGAGKSSLSFLPFLSCALLFNPSIAAGAVAAVVLTTTALLHRQPLWKIAFNTGQAVLAVTACALVYALFLPEALRLDATRGEVVALGFPFTATAFFLVNVSLTSAAIAKMKGEGYSQTLKLAVGPRGANLWYDLLASPIALFPAALYASLHVAAMAIVLLPLLLIRNSYLSKLQLEGANEDLLNVLVMAIETRDPYTSGHSMRVATLARLIAADMGLSAKRVHVIERAALLHDIGKIDLAYAALLRKPYSLTAEERALIQTHAATGAELLTKLSSVTAEVIRAVRNHHERYDGKGYPDGLAGEQIPLAARIIMLCDSVDAMLSDRPYRKALGVAQVRAELVRCSGSQFDPAIVQAILCRNTLERAVQLVDRPAAEPAPQLAVMVG